MRRLSLILIALFLLFAMTAAVGAQENVVVSLSAELGSEVTVYPSFADVSWLSLYLDFAGFTLSSKTSLSYVSAFSVSQTFGLAYAWNWLTLGSELSMGVFPFPLAFDSANIYGVATMFDMPLNGTSFSGGIGTLATIYPAFADDVWFDLSLGVDGFSIASRTTFSLIPVGFSQQRFDIGFGLDWFSFYVWGALSGTWDPSGGVGLYFSFP